MKLSDINPFVRYADVRIFRPDNISVCPYDNRLFYLLSGALEISVNKQKITAHENSIILLRSGIPYALESESEVTLLIINFDFTQKFSHARDSLPLLTEPFYEEEKCHREGVFEDASDFDSCLVLREMQSLERRIYEVINTFKRPSVLRLERVSAQMKVILTELAAAVSETDHEDTDAVMEYIKNNFTGNITNTELGRLTGYHPYHLNRLMTKRVGMSIHQYVIALRLERARELLVNTELPIFQISDACGFSSAAYFSGYFKEKLGMTPSEYRKKHGNVV